MVTTILGQSSQWSGSAHIIRDAVWLRILVLEQFDDVRPLAFDDALNVVGPSHPRRAHLLGIDHHVIERCLNHQPKSMTAVALIYNRHAYAAQMRAAWMRWADHVARIVESEQSNIVKLF